jgi:hypothetical protein
MHVKDIGFMFRREMMVCGSESRAEMLQSDITAVPLVNDLPVISQDMYLHIMFDNEGIIKAVCNLPTDLGELNIISEDYVSEYILQNIVVHEFDEVEVQKAYYLTEYNDLAPAFIAKCLSDGVMVYFRADTGARLDF